MHSVYAKLSSHVLAIQERAAVNMKESLFTLARLKIVLTIKNFEDAFFMIVRCNAVKNYCITSFLDITTGVSGWIVIWGK